MKTINLLTQQQNNKRIALGFQILSEALEGAGFSVRRPELPELSSYRELEGDILYAGTLENDTGTEWLRQEELLLFHAEEPGEEGFYLLSCPGHLTVVCGGDDTGILYGCLELAGRIREQGTLPRELAFGETPVYRLRGPAVGLQKTKIEPPRRTYEYPITRSRFPWFYDRELWSEFLDRLLWMRCNVLYIWSGHPFSSLVKVADYPEALEVTEEEFRENQDIFSWLTRECDRRGIWVVLKFYNIHIPYPFAIAHGLELTQNNIHPLVADYTRKSIREFVRSFPNIGLMVCLGEALRGNKNKTDWFIHTIIPAVREGMEEAGLTREPPLILRGHDCDPQDAMTKAMQQYSNLYTMWKYNGEGLTTCLPRGNWQQLHRSLSEIGTTHIINVHIVADLEPFRFLAPLYIQKCVQAGRYRLGADGLHLYPMFYWDWPYSPDRTNPRLLQADRDRIWFEAWFRYAVQPDREEAVEKAYWAARFAALYELSGEDGALLLEAMEAAGRCAPRLLGRVGITEGNRQTFSLGMTMSQLTNVSRYRPNLELWNSVAVRGEQPEEYVRREQEGLPHIGETPYDCVEEVAALADEARTKFQAIKEHVPDMSGELCRIGTDVEALWLLTHSYCHKIRAAMEVLKYKAGMDGDCYGDISLLEQAVRYLGQSLEAYRELAALTKQTYLYANSMQTPQRKIPFPDGERYGHWTACLPEYQREYENLVKHTKELKEGRYRPGKQSEAGILPLRPAPFRLLSDNAHTFVMTSGSSISCDRVRKLQQLVPELQGLTGIAVDFEKAFEGNLSVTVELSEDSFILIGYMRDKSIQWLQLPDLETNTHADDRGGLAVLYRGAVVAEGCPVADIHAYRYEAGEHTLYFGTGAYLIAGIIPADTVLQPREADYDGKVADTLDWLYE
ncbi:hypothetical protein NSB25_00655 [Acetatifactor muris]|uniref:Alpha glucuronidase N-terminal domain-containing protein n=1 Tax=Acetatifactor muris TaxID=879566 RepID=A0A2K4ZGF1_9FIRM|nr:hypothetical protein [Acetatifactor muris]MCR2045797.1 hypothetical protein [Acetatifactor muris]SOY29534.1 hypothetical protein AMURIS_02255 [Acetatifactor muris]